MNVSDDDALKYIKIFTQLSFDEISQLIEEHNLAPHKRVVQGMLARCVTTMVHGEEEYNKAVTASQILFGQGTNEQVRSLSEDTFLSVFEGVPQYEIPRSLLPQPVTELIAVHTSIVPSKGEARKLIQGGGLSINKEKVLSAETPVDASQLIGDKYLLVQKGKKNYFIIKVI